MIFKRRLNPWWSMTTRRLFKRWDYDFCFWLVQNHFLNIPIKKIEIKIKNNDVIYFLLIAVSILLYFSLINVLCNVYWYVLCTDVGYLVLVGSGSVTFLVGLLLHVMKHSLIAWLNEYSWHQLSTIAQSCLRAWTQLTYFLSFFTISLFPLHFAMSEIFYFAQCPKRR